MELEPLSLAGITLALNGLFVLWLKTSFAASIKAKYDRRLEEFRYEVKVREQAAKVAEYFSYFYHLQSTSSESYYRRANQLGWELALWLPEDVYRHIAKAVDGPDPNHNILTSIIEIRKLLLQTPDSLTADEIFYHFPNAKEKSGSDLS
jgi:hypothetical protein